MGDFYETFDEDAKVAARVLGIALTSRPMGKSEGRIPLAGIPHHALQRYLDELVAAGHRVAIAEQVAPPGSTAAKGLVERRVTRVVTPGTVEDGALLTEGANNWLVAVEPARAAVAGAASAPASRPGAGPGSGGVAERWALAALDATTGELGLRVLDAAGLAAEWERLTPREVLVPEDLDATGLRDGAAAGTLWTTRPRRAFARERATEALTERLGVASLEGYGLGGVETAIGAAGALLDYLEERWPAALAQLRAPQAWRDTDELQLDAHTRRNLDLFPASRSGGEREAGAGGSLLEAIDRTRTPLGARRLRARLGRPLRDHAALERRLDAVAGWHAATLERRGLREALRGVGDLERLLGRVRTGTVTARQLVQLRLGLERLPAVAERARACAEASGHAVVAEPATALAAAAEPAAAIAAALVDEPAATAGEGETLRPGFDPELDALRELAHDARSALAALERSERERTGIGSLKVGYHRVFGYYLELPRSQAARAPEDYEPRQTLAQAQRYRCAALGELEERILSARERLVEAERAALERLRGQVAAAGPTIERAAEAVAHIDVAAALAEVAVDQDWVRPELLPGDLGGVLVRIEGGRHPVVESRLERGAFVPNDCDLGNPGWGAAGSASPDLEKKADLDRAPDIVVLTGPNMGGKSTYLRQTALIVLLAQCGSFVPAVRARLGLVDRICSRVGAQDEIAAGRSTFMVEMLETAEILHTATERSLVLLDEVGRGTATEDGLAIAQAVVEALHHRPQGSPRTLFATHYHELTALAGVLPRVTNRSVAVADEGGELVFLHRILEGGADRSYGVQVAALAGLPRAVVARARELLHVFEAERAGRGGATALEGPDAAGQLSLPGVGAASLGGGVAGTPEPLVEELAALDPDALSPLEALQRLYELRREARARLGVEG